MTTERIAVIGAGTMGHGIAQVAAVAGYQTHLVDEQPAAVDRARQQIQQNLNGGIERGKIEASEAAAAFQRIAAGTSLRDAVADADVVIEAVVEDMAVKRTLFGELARLTRPSAVLATNTSSLSVGHIAHSTSCPERVVGMHFFNPVHIMRLVEVVVHDRTDPAVTERIHEIAVSMGKHPIRVKDSPGFASSRLGVVLGLEAMRMVEQGVASEEDIDKALELGYGHPMGPLRVTDLVGLDVRLAIADYLHAELGDAHYAPPEILRRKVAAGELGKKTGKGFYEWPSSTTR